MLTSGRCWTVRLHKLRFVGDLTVSGSASWRRGEAVVQATAIVSGPNARHTRMSLRFPVAADRPPPQVRTRGRLLLAPSALGLVDLPTP